MTVSDETAKIAPPAPVPAPTPLEKQRAETLHAIATLVGAPATGFSLPPLLAPGVLPEIPLGVPSRLLERRPDVAAAERAMAAANAKIGVARAAYFPSVDLAPAAGWESIRLANLLSAPSRFWSLGGAATGTLFNAGQTRALVRIADADYVAAVAGYRQTVLTAMEEVENGITGLERLGAAGARD